MPIELVDEAGETIDLDKASGGILRKKLEEALAENESLAKQVVTSRADTAIREHGYGLVKPEDLVGVAPNQVEAKAKELQEQRTEARADMVRGVFEERGFEGDELDEAVLDFLGDAKENPPAPQSDDPDFASLTKIGGARPANKGTVLPMDDALGNLTSHFEENPSSRKRT